MFDEETAPVVASDEAWSNIAFGRFVRLMRRQCRISLEKLADDADVDIGDLIKIEADPHHKPELRTTYQLANYFNVPRSGLMQVAGLTVQKNAKLLDETIRFAARSEPTAGAERPRNARRWKHSSPCLVNRSDRGGTFFGQEPHHFRQDG